MPISSEEIPISYTQMPFSSEEININVAEMIEKGTEKSGNPCRFPGKFSIEVQKSEGFQA